MPLKLVAVEEIGGLVPDVAQAVDIQFLLEGAIAKAQHATLGSGLGDAGIAHAALLQEVAHLVGMLVAHLDDDTRVLGEKLAHHVVALDVVEVDAETALHIGKRHLQQGGDQTTSRDIVACEDPAAVDELLHGLEALAEVLRVLDRRHVVANLVEALGKGAAAQLLLAEGEVDMIESGVFVVDEDGGETTLRMSLTSPPLVTMTVPGEMIFSPLGYCWLRDRESLPVGTLTPMAQQKSERALTAR